MQIQEAYVCPHCKGERVQVFGVQRLFSDARYDAVGCPVCGTEWRVYYKVSEVSSEMVKGPDEVVSPPMPVSVDNTPTTDESVTEEKNVPAKTAKTKESTKK